MIYLIIILIITHIAVLYFIHKYIKAYKLNNHNYIHGELEKLHQLFFQNITAIHNNVDKFTEKSERSYKKLNADNTDFIKKQKASFIDVTTFIKSDYHSLTQMLKENNNLLETLLKRTDENITKNNELKPLLVNSSEELEKVYGKIKMLITGYEKGLNDIKGEMEQSLHTIGSILESKIKQLAVSGEKTMLDSIENSKSTIAKITEETNKGLKKVLQDNQIKVLTEKVDILDNEFKRGLAEVQENISELDEIFVVKFKEALDSSKKDKGKTGLNDLKKWLNS